MFDYRAWTHNHHITLLPNPRCHIDRGHFYHLILCVLLLQEFSVGQVVFTGIGIQLLAASLSLSIGNMSLVFSGKEDGGPSCRGVG